MSKKAKKKYPAHPLKRELRAYGLTDNMIAAYLKLRPKYVNHILNGHATMTHWAELKLQRLLDRIKNPVYPEGSVA